MSHSERGLVLALGTTQTLAWASSYYLPAILAQPIAHDLGIPISWLFAAFSVSLLIAALLGPRIGRHIDAAGGRGILVLSNLVIAAGLVLLGLATTMLSLSTAWLVLGIGMALGLYDSAFAALGHIYGSNARRAITGITLLAGFASTVGWPLTAWGTASIGWRETCFAWAAAHMLIGLPMNLFLLPKSEKAPRTTVKASKPHVPIDRPMILLGLAFALAWMVTAAMAAHLPRILEAAGATAVQAVTAGALIGPSQVAARVLEAGFLSRFHPVVSARLATMTHPIGAAVVGILGGAAGSGAFAILHGSGNGILTIARGTVPLAIFGPESYGYRLGLLGAPARLCQAGAPLLFSLLIDRIGAGVLAISSALSLAALLAMCLLPMHTAAPQTTASNAPPKAL